jgi:branched-chain amino acid transport system substrate-binding protein
LPRPSWVSAAGALVVAIVLGACSSGSNEVVGEATLRVYVSLPLSGPSAPDGRDAADAAELALADAGEKAGGLAVEAVVYDDTDGAGRRARWIPAKAAANARMATQDSTAIAYLGELDSGATRASLPWTNQARMLQVSPASAAVDLVAPFAGSAEVPAVQPSGERSFGRVIPADDAQAAAAAVWASKLGWRRVSVHQDGTGFGRSVARAFEEQAADVGLALRRAGRGTLGGYYAGSPLGFPDLQDDVIASSTTGPVQLASDAFLPPYPEGVIPGLLGPTYATSAALDPTQLPPRGREFVADFEREYGRAPGRYAAYGYEAMAAILDSIDRASDPADRPAVVAAFFATANRESILGRYSIDEVGNTTLNRMTGYELRGGRAEPVAELRAPR